tara:strand:- start:466 stop:1065 length:600 start_codon:yes stop_codon:yes gene_type:complete
MLDDLQSTEAVAKKAAQAADDKKNAFGAATNITLSDGRNLVGRIRADGSVYEIGSNKLVDPSRIASITNRDAIQPVAKKPLTEIEKQGVFASIEENPLFKSNAFKWGLSGAERKMLSESISNFITNREQEDRSANRVPLSSDAYMSEAIAKLKDPEGKLKKDIFVDDPDFFGLKTLFGATDIDQEELNKSFTFDLDVTQ